MINYNKTLNNLETLKLEKMREYLPKYLEQIKGTNITITDALYELTSKEIEFKNIRA